MSQLESGRKIIHQDKRRYGAGKGDSPRNCFSPEFRDGVDTIDWGHDIKPIGRMKDGKPIFDRGAFDGMTQVQIQRVVSKYGSS